MTMQHLQEPAARRHDFSEPRHIPELHPILHRLRAEEPVHYSPELSSWLFTSYADIEQALNDPRLSVMEETKRIDALPGAMQEQLLPLRRSFETWMGRGTVEEHERFQRLLRRFFTPARMLDFTPRIQAITDELLDRAIARGSLDIVNDLAHPMAMRVVTELVLDMPSGDLPWLLRRAEDIAGMLEMGEARQLLRGQDAVLSLSEHLRGVIGRHRGEGRGGVIGILLDGKDDGCIRDDQEIIGNIIMFLVVGYHTTANLLCNGLELLFEYPAERERLARDLTLLLAAIDEMMRFRGPVASVRRMAKVDMVVRNRRIAAGQTLVLVLAAGNRDPAVFADPDRFDIGRRDNRHLGFTVGPFACLGKALARIEAETFFRTVLKRLPRIRPRDARPDWVPFRPFARELRTLHVLFD